MRLETKLLSILLVLIMIFGLTACGSSPNKQNTVNTPDSPAVDKANTGSSGTNSPNALPENSEEVTGIKVKVTVGGQVLTATLIDNATTRSLISKFPLTVPMKNLYAREMVYHFPNPLPANEVQQSGYEVGDLSYWTPRHSLVVFYKQNGEVINNLQKIGHFDSNVEFLGQSADTDVKFELLDK